MQEWVGAWAWGLQEGGNQSSGRCWSPGSQGSCSEPGWGTKGERELAFWGASQEASCLAELWIGHCGS